MAKDYLPGLSKKKTWRSYDPMEKILIDWYGKEAGANEITSRLPETESIKEGVDKALKKLVNQETACLRVMKDEWTEIAGNQLAAFTAPASFTEGTLYVEVSHPAWLMQLGRQETAMLLDKIHARTKSRICRHVRFVPKGRNR